MGTAQKDCASQAGMNPYGLSRQIYDQREARKVEADGQALGSRFPGSLPNNAWFKKLKKNVKKFKIRIENLDHRSVQLHFSCIN